ncbi:hypothetical protein ACFL6P_08680 [Candidatus Latescibacterota bacterium]
MNRRNAIKSTILASSAVIGGFSGVSPVHAGFRDPDGYASIVYPGYNGKLEYVPDEMGDVVPDYSYSGFKLCAEPIPLVPVKITLRAQSGDNLPNIQGAIDKISTFAPDNAGFRGAVLLKRGYYEVHDEIRLHTSGVVLRGEGQGEDGTVLFRTGRVGEGDYHKMYFNTHLINISGIDGIETIESSAEEITDDYVPVGAMSFNVKNSGKFTVGDKIDLQRDGNEAWTKELKLDREHTTSPMNPQTFHMDRVITDINGNTLTVDAPVMISIDKCWGGGRVVKYEDPLRICNIGIENIRCVSDYDQSVQRNSYGNMDRSPYIAETYFADENHAWNAVFINCAYNIWVRDITALHFASSCVFISEKAKWVTVQDCTSREQVSVCAGWRRFTYQNSGQLSFFQRCTCDKGRHSFVLRLASAMGPNVYLDCESTRSFGSSEPHGNGVAGTLYDNVKAPLTVKYSKNSAMGIGGINTTFWNCEGPFLVHHAPTAHNYAFGHIGIHGVIYNHTLLDLEKENGHIESWNQHLKPRSLFLAQLNDRHGPKAVINITKPWQIKE